MFSSRIVTLGSGKSKSFSSSLVSPGRAGWATSVASRTETGASGNWVVPGRVSKDVNGPGGAERDFFEEILVVVSDSAGRALSSRLSSGF